MEESEWQRDVALNPECRGSNSTIADTIYQHGSAVLDAKPLMLHLALKGRNLRPDFRDLMQRLHVLTVNPLIVEQNLVDRPLFAIALVYKIYYLNSGQALFTASGPYFLWIANGKYDSRRIEFNMV
jgi:hypothetical protein